MLSGSSTRKLGFAGFLLFPGGSSEFRKAIDDSAGAKVSDMEFH